MNEAVYALRLRQLLLALVLVLTFEGLARKAAPQALGVPLFLCKDVLILVMAFYVLHVPSSPVTSFLWNAYKILFVLFTPPILVTLWHSPLLAAFGAKEYLLYPVVAFATFHAFENARMEQMLLFFRRISLLIIPTAFLAFVELHLSHDSWLNRTVTGDSLEAFQAAGNLRVSSTFSFVAQYCFFLNAQIFILMLALRDLGKHNFLWKIIFFSLIPLLVFGCFVTGSRGAVSVNTAIVLAAGGLVLMKFKMGNIVRVSFVIVSLYLAALALNYFSPNSTAGYMEREHGQIIGISTEVRQRVYDSFFTLSHDKSLRTVFGNGLGIMSNGSNIISTYADNWRNRAPWTETDFSTTLFEGGYYLVFIWYGFRLYVILVTTRRFLSGVTDAYVVTGAFIQAFVIIIGTFGALAIQPPISIWWWMGVGTSLVIWWKCIGPTEIDQPQDPGHPGQIKQVKLSRGRSLYAQSIHKRK